MLLPLLPRRRLLLLRLQAITLLLLLRPPLPRLATAPRSKA